MLCLHHGGRDINYSGRARSKSNFSSSSKGHQSKVWSRSSCELDVQCPCWCFLGKEDFGRLPRNVAVCSCPHPATGAAPAGHSVLSARQWGWERGWHPSPQLSLPSASLPLPQLHPFPEILSLFHAGISLLSPSRACWERQNIPSRPLFQ